MSGDVRIRTNDSSTPNREESQWTDQKTKIHAQIQSNSNYVISHTGTVLGTPQQHETASAFFAKKQSKAAKLLSIPPQHRHQAATTEMETQPRSGEPLLSPLPTNFAATFGRSAPQPPQTLVRKALDTSGSQPGGGSPAPVPKSSSATGKVRVIMKVLESGGRQAGDASAADNPCGEDGQAYSTGCFRIDKKKRQVGLIDPGHLGPAHSTAAWEGPDQPRSADALAPKMFSFDGLFCGRDSSAAEVSVAALSEVLCAVMAGCDATVLSMGHANLGKTATMVGSHETPLAMGVIPTAIAWIFRLVKDRKEKNGGGRFSVRLSAMEIVGGNQEARDLLITPPHTGQSEEGVCAVPPTSGTSTSILSTLTEVKAPTMEKAGAILDQALARRKKVRDSHLLVTVHLAQYPPNSSINQGGQSKLHLIDFGQCERTKTHGSTMTQAGLGHVILGILNGQRHLPFKDSKVTVMLRDCLASVRSEVCLIGHVTADPTHYSESLHTLQLATRIHRMRRRRVKVAGSSAGSGSGSSDESKKLGRLQRLSDRSGSSDFTTSTDPSSSEQSCDTVIYRGPRDDDGTDIESPPVFLPSLNSGDCRAVMSRALRGSSAELPPLRYRSLERSTAKSGGRRGSGSLFHAHSSSGGGATEHHPRSPRHTASPLGSAPPSSHHSTPAHKRHSRVMSPSPVTGGAYSGSLTRSLSGSGGGGCRPAGKMPLHGKVAGYRQPPSVAAQAFSIGEPGTGDGRLSGGYVIRQCGVDSEIWIDTVPNCDSDVIFGGGTGTSSPQTAGADSLQQQNLLYGYMDDHKKKMIQQWVEGQALAANQPAPPPQYLTGMESLAWLEAQASQRDQEGGFRVLTQFKMAESSTSSCSEEVENESQVRCKADVHPVVAGADEDCDEEPPAQHQPEDHQPWRETIHPPSNSTTDPARVDPVDRDDFEERPASSPVRQVCPGENRTRDSATNTQTQQLQHFKLSSIDQDPFRGQRRLPLPRESRQDVPGDGAIKSLDELYLHCEQLVETLSQASEELKSQCAMTSSTHSNDLEWNRSGQSEQALPVTSIDQVEIYQLSEGSEGSIEVADRYCQATEEDIAHCMGLSAVPPPQPLLLTNNPIGSGKAFDNKMARDEPQPPVRGMTDHSLFDWRDKITEEELEDVELEMSSVNEFDSICEDVIMDNENKEDYFSKKFDQLAKLHDLYQSVSSLAAKSQSRIREQHQGESGGGEGLRSCLNNPSGSTLSLAGGLKLNKENDNANSTNSLASDCDGHSMCSEPAWGTKLQQQLAMISLASSTAASSSSSISNFVFDINRNSTLSLNLINSADKDDKGKTEASSMLNPKENEIKTMDSSMSQGPSKRLPINSDQQNMIKNATLEVKCSDPVLEADNSCSNKEGEDRSDSPILEGIDSELAKYAKLRDLDQEYKPFLQRDTLNPVMSAINSSINDMELNSQHFDGWGNGKPSELQAPSSAAQKVCMPSPTVSFLSDSETGKVRNASLTSLDNKGSPNQSLTLSSGSRASTLPRRSPGTGCSSSASETEEAKISRKDQGKMRGHVQTSCSNFVTVPEVISSNMNNFDHFRSHKSSNGKKMSNNNGRESMRKKRASTYLDTLDIAQIEPPCNQRNKPDDSSDTNRTGFGGKNRLAKFSKLWSSMRKLSRSNNNQNNLNCNNNNNVTDNNGGHRNVKDQSRKKGSQSKRTSSVDIHESVHPASKSSRSSLVSSKNYLNNASKHSKNVKGTLSQENLGKNGSESGKQGGKSTSKKTKNKGVNVVGAEGHSAPMPPYPYLYQSRVAGKAASSSSTSSSGSLRRLNSGGVPRSETSGSGTDSGVDCPPQPGSPLPLSASGVRVRGKGALYYQDRQPGSAAENRRSHCKSSSGYESIGHDSVDDVYLQQLSSEESSCWEPSNVKPRSAVPASVAAQYHGQVHPGSSSSPLTILNYDQDFVERMDRNWRFHQVNTLRKQQDQLKTELMSAKARINADPRRWSYDLYTEESGLDPTDPNFVEAFQKETSILDKRVVACRAHVAMTTCFDRGSRGEDDSRSCTADCDPPWLCQEDTKPDMMSEPKAAKKEETSTKKDEASADSGKKRLMFFKKKKT